jgi:metal-dependent amidase/aminoacylase/carboxypeptidase family protein
MTKAAKKAARAKRTTASKKKGTAADLREVRQEVRKVVTSRAPKIAQAVADDVEKKAQVQSMKTLFEMVGLFPESPEERDAVEDDQALARVLLERLGLSDAPEMSAEEAEEKRALEASALAVMGGKGDPVE